MRSKMLRTIEVRNLSGREERLSRAEQGGMVRCAVRAAFGGEGSMIDAIREFCKVVVCRWTN